MADRAKAYLSHPMMAKNYEVDDLMTRLAESLSPFLDVVDPSDPVRKQPEASANLVVARNTADMLSCDFVVAIAHPISAGVAGEVAIARWHGMGIVVLQPHHMTQLSAWMRDSAVVVHTVVEAVSELCILSSDPVLLAALRLRRAERELRSVMAAHDELLLRVVRLREDHKLLVHERSEQRWRDLRSATKTTGE